MSAASLLAQQKPAPAAPSAVQINPGGVTTNHPAAPGLSANPAVRPVAESLTDDQRKALREVNEKWNKEQTPLYAKMRDLRRELTQLERSETVDEKAIRAKAEELGKLEADIAVINAKRDKDIRKVMPKDRYDAMYAPPSARRPGTAPNVVQPGARQPAAPAVNPAPAPK